MSAYRSHVSPVMDWTAGSGDTRSKTALHSARAEFPPRLSARFEEGVFSIPTLHGMNAALKGVEEERRLAYVGLTPGPRAGPRHLRRQPPFATGRWTSQRRPALSTELALATRQGRQRHRLLRRRPPACKHAVSSRLGRPAQLRRQLFQPRLSAAAQSTSVLRGVKTPLDTKARVDSTSDANPGFQLLKRAIGSSQKFGYARVHPDRRGQLTVSFERRRKEGDSDTFGESGAQFGPVDTHAYDFNSHRAVNGVPSARPPIATVLGVIADPTISSIEMQTRRARDSSLFRALAISVRG